MAVLKDGQDNEETLSICPSVTLRYVFHTG